MKNLMNQIKLNIVSLKPTNFLKFISKSAVMTENSYKKDFSFIILLLSNYLIYIKTKFIIN